MYQFDTSLNYFFNEILVILFSREFFHVEDLNSSTDVGFSMQPNVGGVIFEKFRKSIGNRNYHVTQGPPTCL